MASRLRLPEGWSTLFLLSGMLLCTTWAISSARWIGGLSIIQWVTVGAIVSGLLLAKSIFRGVTAHIFSTVYGLAWITFLVGTLFSPYLTWREKMLEQILRVVLWVQQLVSGGQSSDPLIFVLFISALLWVISYVAVWCTFRSQRVWWATLPAGLALLINLYYGPPELSGYLVGYLFCTLVLIVRTYLYTQERNWRKDRVHYEPDISFHFLRYGILATVLLLVTAWSIPSAQSSERLALTVSRFDETWGRVQDAWTRLFSSLRYHGRGSPASFGKRMSLGGPVNLRNVPIFEGLTPGRYWLAVVFDEYTGSEWINNDPDVAYLSAYDDFPPIAAFEMRREVTQTVRMLVSGSNVLFGAPQPVRVSIPTKLYFTLAPPPVEAPDDPTRVAYPSMIHSRLLLKRDDVYDVVSSLSVADEWSLRLAGDEYPAWIRERYLQLPPDLPDRVRALAEEIVAGQDNAYDKASAIEAYLRAIPYNELIEAPPEGQDGVDYFLFGIREGYCDYYASAMAVMARSVGIPARVASGYTRGEYQADREIFLVRERHAHAWVEIYFPRYGWVQFEPTASEPMIVRPQSRAAGDEETSPLDDLDRLGEREEGALFPEDLGDEMPVPPYVPSDRGMSWMGNIRWGVLLAVTGVLLAGFIAWLRWWRGGLGLSAVERAYERMVAYAPWLGCPCPSHQTPYEHATALGQALPAGREQINLITELYVLERFASRPGDSKIASQAWSEIRPQLLRRILVRLAKMPFRGTA
jgi:transglutaminase-like putative cysteine protease